MLWPLDFIPRVLSGLSYGPAMRTVDFSSYLLSCQAERREGGLSVRTLFDVYRRSERLSCLGSVFRVVPLFIRLIEDDHVTLELLAEESCGVFKRVSLIDSSQSLSLLLHVRRGGLQFLGKPRSEFRYVPNSFL